jgi:hypothetical protein
MPEPIEEFLAYLDEPSDLEYGDFKRRTDMHLRRLVEKSPPFNSEQARALSQLRDDLIWQDHPDEEIENFKESIRQKVLALTAYYH